VLNALKVQTSLKCGSSCCLRLDRLVKDTWGPSCLSALFHSAGLNSRALTWSFCSQRNLSQV